MFWNETGTIAVAFGNMDSTVTGSILLTFALMFLFILLIAFIFRISPELIFLLLTPLGLVMISYKSELMVIGVLILIVDGFILAKALISLFNG